MEAEEKSLLLWSQTTKLDRPEKIHEKIKKSPQLKFDPNIEFFWI
jgi:hypothetical protein